MIGAWKALTGAGRAIVAGLATIALLCVLMAVLTVCGGKAAIRKGEAGQTLAEGRTGAAQDASAVRDRADARDDTISNAVTEGTDDVRQAPDRSSANLAARRGVCQVNPSAGPDCRMLLTDPGRED